MPTQLTENDYSSAAKLLNCDIPAIKAVAEVESAGNGFLSDGKPKILFEGHVFYRYTKGKYANSHPNICYEKWDKSKYLGGAREYERFNEALELDRQAALLSISCGKFQIMGFNFAHCGFLSVEIFFEDMHKNEGAHLKAFCNYLIETGLDDELRQRRWADFAKKYNGPSYQKNQYDIKLMKAYVKYAEQSPF